MTWTKLGDSFIDDAYDLSDAAFRLHTEALIYSNRRLLDLVIPKREVRRFTAVDEYDVAAEELVDRGWWADKGDRWWIGLKWPEWQRDRSQVEHRRAQVSAAQRRRRRHQVGDHSMCLPKNCPHATSSDDTADDYRDDPGRVGSGREELNEENAIGSWP